LQRHSALAYVAAIGHWGGIVKKIVMEHFNKWGWIIAALIIVIVNLRFYIGREAFCGDENEHCFREWFSALGGWLAVGAAIPTIIYLSRQVSDAAKNHREMVQLQTSPKYLLAKHALAIAILARDEAVRDYNFWVNFRGTDLEFRKEVHGRLAYLKTQLARTDITKFNDELGLTTVDVVALQDSLTTVVGMAPRDTKIVINRPVVLKNILNHQTLVLTYYREIVLAADTYIKHIDALGQVGK
jgi:hypothetical protein